MANLNLQITGKLALKYLKRFPNLGSRPLARKMYNENKLAFKSENSACSSIKYHRGTMGNKNRSTFKDRGFKTTPRASNDNQYELPASRSTPREVFKLPTSIKKVLLLSDLHFPYHNESAILAAIKDGKKENVDCVFVNGDMLDFYQLSFHEKDPRKTSIPDELEMGRQFFKFLRHHFPKANIYFIPGNHELRMERYLKVKAPELLDMEEFRLDILLRVREHSINYINHGTKCYFGKLLVEHGDKMKGSGGVNPARTLFLRLKRHAACGHFHRTTENVSKVYDGEPIVTYSTGCLCELEPGYLEVNEHNHGFAIVEMYDKGHFTFRNKKIINGKVY